MRLMYLPANAAWVFVFGEDIRTASIEPMGDHGRFFNTRVEAVDAAHECGLVVRRDGTVESEVGARA